VIGAGPYGLAVSAYLLNAGIPTLTFGKPLEFWRNMPSGIYLKSIWSASHLSDPGHRYTLDNYVKSHNLARPEPINLEFFQDYGTWFQKQAVPQIDETYIQSLTLSGNIFNLILADGREVQEDRVIVATGIANFTHIPTFAQHLPPEMAAHTEHHGNLSRFKGQRVAMIGSGQSALEYAALLHETGAEVEIIARQRFIWHSKVLYEYSGPVRHLFYPPGDVGPPGVNWLISYPMIYNQLPASWRQSIHKRAIRPTGAKWLRPRVENQICLTPLTTVIEAKPQQERLRLQLNDGGTREVDFLFLGTGYQPDFRRLPFLAPELAQQIQGKKGFPELNTWFESSVPNLHFVGALAGQNFGPLCRFLSGAHWLAKQIARGRRLVD